MRSKGSTRAARKRRRSCSATTLKELGSQEPRRGVPDYGTSIGEEIARALQGEREYGADVMQLLFIANRYERKADIERWVGGGLILLCDRYIASSIAYGEGPGTRPAVAGGERSGSSRRRI